MSEITSELKKIIVERDNHSCLRCKQVFRDRKLYIQHLTPLSDGGYTILSNLVTLCKSCKDYVDANNLRTSEEIVNGLDNPAIVWHTADEGPDAHDKNRPTWHKYIYGGKRR